MAMLKGIPFSLTLSGNGWVEGYQWHIFLGGFYTVETLRIKTVNSFYHGMDAAARKAVMGTEERRKCQRSELYDY
jgi:hypothetical protein